MVRIMAEGTRLHAHSRGQASVALSSCEAEVMAASERHQGGTVVARSVDVCWFGDTMKLKSRWTVVQHTHSSIDDVLDA